MKSLQNNSYMLRSKKYNQRTFKNGERLIEKIKKKEKKVKDFSEKRMQIKAKINKNNNNLRRKNEENIKQKRFKSRNFQLSQASTECLSMVSTIDSTKIKTKRKILKKIAFNPIKSLGNIPNSLIPKRSRSQFQESNDIIMKDACKKNDFFENLENFFAKSSRNFEDIKSSRFIMKIKETKIRKNFLLGKPKEIYSSLRSKTVCWMSELCDEFKFQRNTFYSAVLYIDIFISKIKSFEPIDYKLLAIAALSLSSKFEEVYIQDLSTYRKKADKFYEMNKICEMEILLLKYLDYELGGPQINNVLYLLLNKFDDYVVKNKIKVNYKNKKIMPLFIKEPNDFQGIINRILIDLDFLILDDKIYEYNPFKIIYCLIFMTLLSEISPDCSTNLLQSYFTDENLFRYKFCEGSDFIQIINIVEKFTKEVSNTNIQSLFHEFKFISNFLQFNTKKENDYKNPEFRKDLIYQKKISYESGIRVIQMIEKKNDS